MDRKQDEALKSIATTALAEEEKSLEALKSSSDDRDDERTWEFCFDESGDIGYDHDRQDMPYDPMSAEAKESWRNELMQSCLQIARNKRALHSLFIMHGRREWAAADVTLLGHSLVGNTNLTLLTICIDSNMFMPVVETALSAAALRQGVAKSKLENICLVCMGGGWQTSLLEGVAMSPHVKSLTISNAPVNMPCLSRIIAASNRAIPTEPNSQPSLSYYLTRLGLLRCQLNNVDMLALSLALADNLWLVALSLNGNFISNIGIVYFCQHWRVHSPLQELDLSSNRIGPRGAQLIVSATAKHPAMRALALNHNQDIGHAGLQLMGEQLPHLIGLQYLGMHCCAPFGTDKSATQASACRALADGLRSNTSLLTVRAGKNQLGAKGVQMLMRATANHPRLKEIALKSDDSIGLLGLKLIGLELPFVKLLSLQLDSVCDDLEFPQTKLARKAGQALLQGVRRNHHLIKFTLEELDDEWMIPIQFHINLNQICRPLFRRASITTAFWPYILDRFYKGGKISFMYYVLLEQPWLVNSRGNF